MKFTIETDVLFDHAVLREHLQGARPAALSQCDCARRIIEYLAHARCESPRITWRKLQSQTIYHQAETADVRGDEQTTRHHLFHGREWRDVFADRRHHDSRNTLQYPRDVVSRDGSNKLDVTGEATLLCQIFKIAAFGAITHNPELEIVTAG